MKAVVIQPYCSRVWWSCGGGERCYTTSGLPVLPPRVLQCLSQREHLPSLSFSSHAFSLFQRHSPFFFSVFRFSCPAPDMQYHHCKRQPFICLVSFVFLFARYTPEYQHSVGMLSDRRVDRFLCQPAEMRHWQHCPGMHPITKVEETVKKKPAESFLQGRAHDKEMFLLRGRRAGVPVQFALVAGGTVCAEKQCFYILLIYMLNPWSFSVHSSMSDEF